MRAYVYKVSLLQQFGFAFLLLVLGAYAGLSVNPHQWWATTLIRLALRAPGGDIFHSLRS